jgi:hypothetical protein
VPAVRRPRSRLRASATALLVAAVVALAAACSSGSPTPRQAGAQPSDPGTRCTLSAKAVPSCGVLWGISSRPPTVDALHTLESAVGRPFDFVYRYHDVDDTVPDDAERAVVAEGRLLHIAIAARQFGGGRVSWQQIAAGRYDDTLTAQARGIASLKVPVFVTFEQEASQRKKLGVSGTADQFHQAWRHLHDLYQQAGATNAVWTWVMTGSDDNLQRAASLWPGNDVVDWISWNVYNQSGCNGGQVDPAKYESFADKLRVFYDFVHQQGAAAGIDTSKPMMVSETGSVQYQSDLGRTADWYASIPQVLRQYPQIKAVGLWDSATDTCDYDFDGQPQVLAGVRKAGLDPYVDVHGAVSPKG